MSWQQALLDKSQGTKEEKLSKRQAPAPRRAREAHEAGGSMNVEKTGKGGLPANLEWPLLKLALEGRLLWHLSCPHTPSLPLQVAQPSPGHLDMELGDPRLPIPTPGVPPSW